MAKIHDSQHDETAQSIRDARARNAQRLLRRSAAAERRLLEREDRATRQLGRAQGRLEQWRRRLARAEERVGRWETRVSEAESVLRQRQTERAAGPTGARSAGSVPENGAPVQGQGADLGLIDSGPPTPVAPRPTAAQGAAADLGLLP